MARTLTDYDYQRPFLGLAARDNVRLCPVQNGTATAYGMVARDLFVFK